MDTGLLWAGSFMGQTRTCHESWGQQKLRDYLCLFDPRPLSRLHGQQVCRARCGQRESGVNYCRCENVCLGPACHTSSDLADWSSWILAREWGTRARARPQPRGVAGVIVRVVRATVTLQHGQVEQLPVQVLLLVLQSHVLILIHRRQQRPGPGQSVPGVIEVSGGGVRRGAVWRSREGGGVTWGSVQHQRRGVMNISLSGEPPNGLNLRGGEGRGMRIGLTVRWRLILSRLAALPLHPR